MRTRVLLAVVSAATVGGLALPSQAASAGTRTLYFANEGGPHTGSCVPDYVLDKAPVGNPCSAPQVGVSGNGLLVKDTFLSVRKAVGFKLSSGQHLTGVVYMATYFPLNLGPVSTLPGQISAKIDIIVNGIDLGTVNGTGQALAPNTDVSIPIDVAIPPSLNKKVVKNVEVDIAYQTAAGVTGTEYSAANSSKLVFPTTR